MATIKNISTENLLGELDISGEHYSCLNSNPVNSDKDYMLYWLQGSQRVSDNKALSLAGKLANRLDKPLVVAFLFMPDYPGSNFRHFNFMYEGIRETLEELQAAGAAVQVEVGKRNEFFKRISEKASLILTDQGFLQEPRNWRKELGEIARTAVIEIASNTVVPVETASQKEEYAAYTIRKKINSFRDKFLKIWEFPELNHSGKKYTRIPDNFSCRDKFLASLNIPAVTPELRVSIKGGYAAAKKQLESFTSKGLKQYDKSNDPDLNIQSGLSPYLHFGNISPREIALEVINSSSRQEVKEEFLEELIVRRELSHNFIYYNHDYNKFPDCLPEWATTTLKEHSQDERDYDYSPEEFEQAETHDKYWNAAQLELIYTGNMHNYMRMYWGKKILEWSAGPEVAFTTALYLNNRYALDGRDPNSYAGVAWCFGKHDRAWQERPIYGKVRYMNRRGLERKFKMEDYLERIKKLTPEKNIAGD